MRSRSDSTNSCMIPEMLRKAPVARMTFLALMISPDSNVNANSPDTESRLRPLTPDLIGIELAGGGFHPHIKCET